MRAVDRFYRRIKTINKEIPNIDLTKEASEVALYAAYIRVNFYFQVLKEHLNGIFIAALFLYQKHIKTIHSNDEVSR